MWTVNDKRFLKTLGIDANDPPVDLPRYRVAPSERSGWYMVYDAAPGRKYGMKSELGPQNFKDPRKACEELARQLNQQEMKKP